MTKVMGYKGGLFYGTKGSTAATRILNRVDVNYDCGVNTGSTMKAGNGTDVPIETGEAVSLSPKIDWKMIVDTDDAALIALEAAAKTGNPIALRYIRNTGALGFDCDCVIKSKQGSPIGGEAVIDYEVVAVSDSLRDPILNG